MTGQQQLPLKPRFYVFDAPSAQDGWRYTVVWKMPVGVEEGKKWYFAMGMRDDGMTRSGYFPYRLDKTKREQLGEKVEFGSLPGLIRTAIRLQDAMVSK